MKRTRYVKEYAKYRDKRDQIISDLSARIHQLEWAIEYLMAKEMGDE
tara:strand:- start:279 stop:419 length:141 start_codon:yes stop_codon:yes gene_type:complete